MDENLIPKFELRKISDDGNTVDGALGISKDRSKALQKIILHGCVDEKNWEDIMQDVASACKHLNEFAFGMFLVGTKYESRNRGGMPPGLRKLLGGGDDD